MEPKCAQTQDSKPLQRSRHGHCAYLETPCSSFLGSLIIARKKTLKNMKIKEAGHKQKELHWSLKVHMSVYRTAPHLARPWRLPTGGFSRSVGGQRSSPETRGEAARSRIISVPNAVRTMTTRVSP